MKRKKNYAVVTVVLLLVMMLSITGFAEDLTVEVIDGTEEVTEEITEEGVTATIVVDGEEEIVLTVDAEGKIISADYAKDLNEEEDTEEDNPLADLVDKTLLEGLEALNDTEESMAYSVTIYSDDNELIDWLEQLLEEKFGEWIEIDSIKLVDLDNPNALRFMMAQELGITPGKMNLLEKLGKGYGEDALIYYAAWAEKSVKEIMAAVKEERKGSEEVTASITEETQTENSNKPVKAPKTNNGKGNKK